MIKFLQGNHKHLYSWNYDPNYHLWMIQLLILLSLLYYLLFISDNKNFGSKFSNGSSEIFIFNLCIFESECICKFPLMYLLFIWKSFNFHSLCKNYYFSFSKKKFIFLFKLNQKLLILYDNKNPFKEINLILIKRLSFSRIN